MTNSPLDNRYELSTASDGRFYFKLVHADGRVLVQSEGHASPKDAGQLIAKLKAEGAALVHRADEGLHLAGAMIGRLEDGIELAEVLESLAAFAEVAHRHLLRPAERR